MKNNFKDIQEQCALLSSYKETYDNLKGLKDSLFGDNDCVRPSISVSIIHPDFNTVRIVYDPLENEKLRNMLHAELLNRCESLAVQIYDALDALNKLTKILTDGDS